MCARSESLAQMASTSQKRPLSIIAEQDDDDSDVIHIANCLQALDIRGRDKVLASNGVLHPRDEIKLHLTKQKSFEIKRAHKLQKWQTKSSTNESKSRLPTTTPPESISNVELDSINLPSTSQLESGDAYNFISLIDSQNNNRPDCTGLPEQAQDETSTDVDTSTQIHNSRDVNTSTQIHNSKQQIQDVPCSCPRNTQTVISSSMDILLVTSLSHTSSSEELHKIEAVHEELVPLVPSPHSSSGLRPEFLQSLVEPTAGPRTIHDFKGPPTHNTPEINLTCAEETHGCADLPASCTHDTDEVDNATFNQLSVDVIRNNNSPTGVTNSACNCSNFNRAKKGTHFSCRTSKIESTGALLGSEFNVEDGIASESHDSPAVTQLSDFRRLKETTEKLHLSTRRPSTMLWRQKYVEGQGLPGIRSGLNGDATEERLTVERKQRINHALEWLRTELQEMRSQDQNLARQLLTIRQEIHQLKLKRSTEEHQELIEEFQSELDDLQEFSDVVDFPQSFYGDNPLKHIGITRLNMNARRFSAC